MIKKSVIFFMILFWFYSLVFACPNFEIKYPDKPRPLKKIDLDNDGQFDRIVEINPWGIKTSSWFWKMLYDCQKNKIIYQQDIYNVKTKYWQWVYSYPEIYVWNKPRWNFAWWKSNLPNKIKNLDSLTVVSKYKLTHWSKVRINVAMEWWFTKNKFEKHWVDKDWIEFMIMFYKHNLWIPPWRIVWSWYMNIQVDWKYRSEYFDMYLCNRKNCGHRFITFFAENSNLNWQEIKFDILSFVKVASKFVPDVYNLYLEDWELWTENWADDYKTHVKIQFEIEKFDVVWVLKKINNNKITFFEKIKAKIDKLFLKLPKNLQTKEKLIKIRIRLKWLIESWKYDNNDLMQRIINYFIHKINLFVW